MDEKQWYDLFEDVAAKVKHENLTRQQQHAQLARIVAAERERWIRLVCERLDTTVMSGYASTKECEAARAALRGVLVYENAA